MCYNFPTLLRTKLQSSSDISQIGDYYRARVTHQFRVNVVFAMKVVTRIGVDAYAPETVLTLKQVHQAGDINHLVSLGL